MIRSSTLIPLLLALLVIGTLNAQGPVGPPTLEFSFSNPGARSMGLGGAFVALADDATAAFANPSGLTQLVEPEVSMEGRLWRYKTDYTVSGRAGGPPTGLGIDTNPGLEFSESRDELAGVSFLSYVQPGKRWSAAFFRHQFANFESNTKTQGLFGGDQCCFNRYHDVIETTDLEIVSYGLAGGYRVSDDLSVGVGLMYYDGEILFSSSFFAPDHDTLEAAFAPNSYLPGRRSLLVQTRGEEKSIGFSGGFLWKSGQWQIGGVYRSGPSIGVELIGTAGPAYDPDIPSGTVVGRVPVELEFPNVFSLGGSFRSRDDRLTVSFEWDHVGYSAYLDSIDDPELETSGMMLDDANELHVGAEYVFLTSDPIIALRGGLWLDPDHLVRYRGNDTLASAILQDGEDELHYAIGFGVVFHRIQIDIGIDLSERADTASVSAIYSF